MARIQLLAHSYLEALPSPEASPEELTLEHLEDDQFAVQTQVDADCRYAQKLSQRRKKVFRWAMGRIPREEREAVRLSLVGKSQQEIAAIQGVSQVAVLYRLRTAQQRLQWLCTVGATVTAAQIRSATAELLTAVDQRILLAWWDTGSQTEAAIRVFGDCDKPRALGDCGKQKKCQRSLIRTRNILKNTRGLSRISKAVESMWSNPWLRQGASNSNRPIRRLAGLSRIHRIEANCSTGAQIPAMAACVSEK